MRNEQQIPSPPLSVCILDKSKTSLLIDNMTLVHIVSHPETPVQASPTARSDGNYEMSNKLLLLPSNLTKAATFLIDNTNFLLSRQDKDARTCFTSGSLGRESEMNSKLLLPSETVRVYTQELNLSARVSNQARDCLLSTDAAASAPSTRG